MSRSRKKHSFIGNGGSSEKLDKQFANRKLRKRVKSAIRNQSIILPEKREVSNLWNMAKDGKHYFNSEDWPKGMRK